LGHAPLSRVRRRSLVLPPSATAMSVSGGRRVTCMRLSSLFFFLSTRVGHGFLFLVLAVGGDGFRQSVVTGVVLCTVRVVHALTSATIFRQWLV